MTWVKKDRRVSGNTVINDTIEGRNLNCIDTNGNLTSNSEFHVPSVTAVKAYIGSSAGKQIVVEGFIEDPTALQLVELIAAQGIEIDNGQEFLYIQLSLDDLQPVNSKVFTYSDESGFIITTTKTVSDDNDYLRFPERQDGTNVFTTHTGGFPKTAAFSVDDVNGTCTATNASTSDYIGFIPKQGYTIGLQYKLEIDISATNGNGLKVDIIEPEDGQHTVNSSTTIAQNTLAYQINFYPTSANDVIVIYGTGNSNVTISDIQVTQVATTTTTQKIRFPKDAQYRIRAIQYTDIDRATFNTGFAVLYPSQVTPNVVAGNQELVLTLERTTSGYSSVEYELTAEYEYIFTDPVAGNITLDGVRTTRGTISVRKD